MNTRGKRVSALLLTLLFILPLTSCTPRPAETMTEVITQKVADPSRIPITVLVKNAFTINTFEAAAEAALPRLDIVQVGNYSYGMGIAEYERRLEHDDLTDVIMTWPLEVGEKYWEERLIDLSSLPLTGKYTTSMLDDVSRDGKLFYLPGPSQMRGIVYNKTLFAENGWEVPVDFESFVALCKTIEESGIRSLQLGLENSEVLDTAFVGYGLQSSFSSPQNAQFFKDYNNGIGSFGDNYTPALQTFQRLVSEGILQPGDLSIDYADREKMLFERSCAMVEDSVLLARKGMGYNGSTDEFALMPFFNPGKDADWSRLYHVCYIGLSKKLEKPENKEKYDLVMELLEYISTPEGQSALAGDTGGMISALNGVSPPDIPEIDYMLNSLNSGRYSHFPTFTNSQGALRRGLAGMVEGTHTVQDVIAMVDAQNTSPTIKLEPIVIGTAAENFSLTDTGSIVTDAMRDYSGCDIALFLDNGKDGITNGKGITGKLYKGDITVNEIRRVMPDTRQGEKSELWKVTMTGADLLTTLEYSIPVENNKVGWFYYFSGLKMEYAVCATQGQRIRSITDIDGNKIDPQKVYSVAIMDYSVPEEFFISCEKTGTLIADIVAETISNSGTVSPSKDGRFILVAE